MTQWVHKWEKIKQFVVELALTEVDKINTRVSEGDKGEQKIRAEFLMTCRALSRHSITLRERRNMGVPARMVVMS